MWYPDITGNQQQGGDSSSSDEDEDLIVDQTVEKYEPNERYII